MQFYRFPSSYDPNSIIGKIQKLFWKIIGFFITLPKPSRIKFEALIANGNSSNPILPNSSALVENIPQLFQRCCSKEDDHLEPLFKDCESLIDQVKQAKMAIDELQLAEKTFLLKEKIKLKIQDLGVGRSLLLPATMSTNVNIFYLLSRSEDGCYTLQIIGSDNWMGELSGIPTKKIGGKEKVLSQIEFKGVSADYFNEERINSLFCEPLIENVFNIPTVKSHLENMPVPQTNLNNREDLWVTKSSNPRKVFGLVAQHIRQSSTPQEIDHKAARKRLEFQTKLLAFVDFYKEARFDIAPDSENAASLKRLIREIAREATLFGKKNYLSKEDLGEIQRELSFIEQTLASESDDGVVLGKAMKTPSYEMASETLALDKHIKPPAVLSLKEVKPFQQLRQIEGLKDVTIFNEDIIPTSLSSKEIAALQSNQISTLFELFEMKIEQANQYVSEGKKSLAVASVMELVKNMKFDFREGSCWRNITVEEILKAQLYFCEFSRIIVEQRTEETPAAVQFMILLKLNLFSEGLSYEKGVHYSVNDIIRKMFIRDKYNDKYRHDNTLKPDYQFPRSFYQFDNECYQILDSVMELRDSFKDWFPILEKLGIQFLKENKDIEFKNLYLDGEQKKYFNQFLEGEDLFLWYDFSYTREFNNQAFPKIQRAAKAFRNPLLFAALSQMNLTEDLRSIREKLHNEGKYEYNSSFAEKVGEEWSTYNRENFNPENGHAWTDEELEQMQKGLDRGESFKLPEAATDNPQAVFDIQMENLLQKLEEAGEENPYFQNDLSHRFKKEELTDLLYLLREKYPQLEALAFLKTHPHLLFNSDVRNYLEIVMFDPLLGASLIETLDRHQEFVKTVPDILAEEIQKYRQLAEKEPIYTDHLLFILSLAKKSFMGHTKLF